MLRNSLERPEVIFSVFLGLQFQSHAPSLLKRRTDERAWPTHSDFTCSRLPGPGETGVDFAQVLVLALVCCVTSDKILPLSPEMDADLCL